MGTPVRRNRQHPGVPVYSYPVDPVVPQVSVMRIDRAAMDRVRSADHAHDFPGLVYFERDGGSLRSGNQERPIEAGDLYVIAPGDVVGVGRAAGLEEASGSGVFFTADALGPDRPGPFLSWRAHPLLFPFVRGSANGALRLQVPPSERPDWVRGIAAIEEEIRDRRDGYRQAALAHLVLLLVSVSRLASDVVGDLRLNNEGRLADVFAVIERRYRERLSLRDVARAVNLTPGHLTTVVRRRTGRTVQEWIVERRMTEARRLLVETDLAVREVGRLVGFADPGYFTRSFRRAHGTAPRAWRAAALQP
ncbi:AraC family transcriptional regulator [Pseudonocardia sp. H11422]|uniref:helix-turn-helix transcriptional regulator n=1 Tax=Pseudonocardia sp. H11422 TaxID=2835866 RepID=UPI0027E2A78B|nr:AraC family transcriptional regulator [Pseudonocardia sp. H11422]